MLYQNYLSGLEECPFCKESNHIIQNGKYAYLTYALAPYHKHHLLVLPKRHVESIAELTSEEQEEIDGLQARALQMLRKLNYASVSLLLREGPVNINKSIRHTHFHIIPEIQIGDLDHKGEPRKILEESEVAALMNELLPLV